MSTSTTMLPGGSLHINLTQAGPMSTTRFAPTAAAQEFCGTSGYNAYQLALCHGGAAAGEVCSLVGGLYLCPRGDTYHVVIPRK